jgi:heme oxygenase
MSDAEVDKVLFTKRLRDATKSIHDMSDKLVNVKLGFAMSDDRVWAEGMLVFYEVFRFLEEALDRNGDSLLGEYNLVAGLRRAGAIEADLDHYLGKGWNGAEYAARPEVAAYLTHLKAVEAENPYLLVAYIYHLYMGLLSGGQGRNSPNSYQGRDSPIFKHYSYTKNLCFVTCVNYALCS